MLSSSNRKAFVFFLSVQVTRWHSSTWLSSMSQHGRVCEGPTQLRKMINFCRAPQAGSLKSSRFQPPRGLMNLSVPAILALEPLRLWGLHRPGLGSRLAARSVLSNGSRDFFDYTQGLAERGCVVDRLNAKGGETTKRSWPSSSCLRPGLSTKVWRVQEILVFGVEIRPERSLGQSEVFP